MSLLLSRFLSLVADLLNILKPILVHHQKTRQIYFEIYLDQFCGTKKSLSFLGIRGTPSPEGARCLESKSFSPSWFISQLKVLLCAYDVYFAICASCGFLVLLLIHFLNVFARIIAIPFYDVCNIAIKTTMIYCQFQSSESSMHNYKSSSYLVLSYLYFNVSFHLFSCPDEPEDPFPEVRE